MASNRFEEMQAFVEVVEHQGFTAAAEKLDVAKSSLSRRVAALEQRMGVQLLQRTTRKLSLTSEGEQYYQRSTRILAELDEVEEQLGREHLQPRGRIRLAAPMSFSQEHLSDVLALFLLEYPEITLDIDLNDRQVDLLEDRFDLAIRIGKLEDSSLKARKLGVIRFATGASPDYLRQAGEPGSPRDLVDHRGLYYSNISAQAHWLFRVDGVEQSYLPRKVLASNNGDFLARAAVRGLGIVNSPTFILYRYFRCGELRPILQDFRVRETGLYAVFPPGRTVPARIRLLVDFLGDRFGDQPLWDQFG